MQKKAYETVRAEFKQYNVSLLEKPEIIVFTKTDLATEEMLKKNRKIVQRRGKKVLTCSIYDQKSLDAVKQILENSL